VDWIDPEIDPRPRAEEGGFPSAWLRIATDGSGHAYYFVDAADGSEDPQVWHWDEELSSDDPLVEFEHLSGLLTWIVLEATVREGAVGPLGTLRDGVQVLDLVPQPDAVRALVAGWSFAPWVQLGDAELRRNEDRSLFLLNEGTLVARSEQAFAPIAALLEAEETREADEREQERGRRAAATAQGLEERGQTAEELVERLLELRPRLTPLESAFLQDFRARVACGDAGQWAKAAEIVDKYVP
jgi:hypothetical protein